MLASEEGGEAGGAKCPSRATSVANDRIRTHYLLVNFFMKYDDTEDILIPT